MVLNDESKVVTDLYGEAARALLEKVPYGFL
jgi:hypothetical protein